MTHLPHYQKAWGRAWASLCGWHGSCVSSPERQAAGLPVLCEVALCTQRPIQSASSLPLVKQPPLPLAFQNWDPLVALPVNSHSRIVIRLWLCALIFEKQGPVHIVNLRRPHGSFIPVGRYVSAFLFWLTFWAVCIIFYKTELKKQWLLTGGFRKPCRL